MFVKKGVVIPKGGAGDFDEAQAYLPAAIKHNDKIYVYYAGKDAAGKYRLGLAVSEDGMNFIKKGVVVPIGAGGEFDDSSLYGSTSIKHNDKIYIYYEAWNVANATYYIGLAISEDGVNFVKKGVVITLGGAGEFDHHYVFLPSVLKHNDKFYLYYTGKDTAAGNYRIGLAISNDGMNFVKKGVVIPLGGGGGDFDDLHTLYPNVMKHNDKIYGYYLAKDGGKYRIGLAISDDGMNFIKKGVVIPIGVGGAFDDNYLFGGGPIEHNDKIYLYYNGQDGALQRIGLAISNDWF